MKASEEERLIGELNLVNFSIPSKTMLFVMFSTDSNFLEFEDET